MASTRSWSPSLFLKEDTNKMTNLASALVLVTNGISAAMARAALAHDGHDLANTVLIKQRKVDVDWQDACLEVVSFEKKASITIIGQVNMVGYHYRSLAAVRRLLKSGTLADIYIPNIDNLINNHILRLKQSKRLPGNPRLSVLVEGFMNYQHMGVDDRAGWRWAMKPSIAKLLGLRYIEPTTHLSGSYENGVTRTFAYSPTGLKAPPEGVVLCEFPKVEPRVTPDPKVALLVLTGIAQWMTPSAFEAFRQGFAKWLNRQGFEKVLIKRHPIYPLGDVESLIERSEVLDESRSLEKMAADIPGATVVGFCTTALVTLRLMRPDLKCIDWGSDFYCKHAYHGDTSIVDVLKSAGTVVVPFEPAV